MRTGYAWEWVALFDIGGIFVGSVKFKKQNSVDRVDVALDMEQWAVRAAQATL